MPESPSESGAERPERAQLVLAAAALIALALVPVAVAYLQLGSHPDVAASTDYDGHGANAERFLERAVHEAGVVGARGHVRMGAQLEVRDGDRHQRQRDE